MTVTDGEERQLQTVRKRTPRGCDGWGVGPLAVPRGSFVQNLGLHYSVGDTTGTWDLVEEAVEGSGNDADGDR